MADDHASNAEVFCALAGIVAAILFFCWLAFGDGFDVIYYRWYLGHHPDTLRIRCEREQDGILIGDSCFSKAAVIWPETRAPR